MGKKVIKVPELYQHAWPYSYGTMVEFKVGTKLIFVCGQVPVDAQGNIVAHNDMKGQIKQVIENIRTVLKAAGATLDDVVKMNMYTPRIPEFLESAEWRKESPELFGPGGTTGLEKGTVTTLIGIPRLSWQDYLIEIEAIASIG